jgi:SSS family solute:Na+ symporter
MTGLAWQDWTLLILAVSATIGIGLYYGRGSGKDFDSFFLGGRNLTWFVSGLSMVATTFAVDTPLSVTEMVASNGISGNWQWWNFVIGGMLTSLFFARMWYLSGVKTEAELISLRYSGKAARLLRIFKSAYLGLFINIFIMAWVNLAFISILEVFFAIDKGTAMLVSFFLMGLIAVYSNLAGLKGVVITDNFQFLLAMLGSVLLAVLTLQSDKIGGLEGLKNQLPESAIAFFPDFSHQDPLSMFQSLPLSSFIVFIGFTWWATWYPGNEPGGGGYIAQRILSTRSAKDASASVFFFQLLNLGVRPWPWIIVALCSLILYPGAGKEGYVMAMKDHLPIGVKGLMLAAFFSAYMSTISTHMNWGAGIVVNDVLPSILKNNTPQKQVFAGRVLVFVFMLFSSITSLYMESIKGAWQFMIECGAGLGSVLLLRWFWSRITVWSEIVATLAPILAYLILTLYNYYTQSEQDFATRFLLLFIFTTAAWLIATFVSKPEKEETLLNFYTRTQVPIGWRRFRGAKKPNPSFLYIVITWLFAVILSYGLLFTVGSALLKPLTDTFMWGFVTLISAGGVYYFGKKSVFK